MFKAAFSITIITCLLIACSNETTASLEKVEKIEYKADKELSKIMGETKYDRYFLFKGDNLASVKAGLIYWSETYTINWTVKESKYKDWILVKMIKEDIIEDNDFHNMASLFFNTPGKPVNLSKEDIGITIAIDPVGKNSYISYITKEIYDNFRAEDPASCESHAVFQNNQKAIVSSCFSGALEPWGQSIPDFNEFLKQQNIDLKEIQNDSIPGELITLKTNN